MRHATSSGPVRASASAWKRDYSPAELVEVSCPLCGASEAKTVATEFGIDVARCSRCRIVYTRTQLPTPQAHYDISREATLRKYGPIFRGERGHDRDSTYDEHLARLETKVPPGDLLDVGTHCGFFLRRARARGWRTHGVEPSSVSAALAREEFGLEVTQGTLKEAGLASGSFDVATLVDVLEHIATPRDLLADVRRVLRPGGYLLVKVPNVRYVLAKYHLLRRIPHLLDDALDAREHLVYYSSVTLRRTLIDSGFSDVELAVPSPIPGGGTVRRAVRAGGVRLARFFPRGEGTPLATDLLALARAQ